MSWIKNVLSSDTERELLYSTSRSIIIMVAVIYTAWHFIATLGWPQVFSPSLWATTVTMLVVITLTLRLLNRHYIWANAVWFSGLTAAIYLAYATYHQPVILLLLILLPLIAIVTVGAFGAALVILIGVANLLAMPRLFTIPPIPEGYVIGVTLGSIFTTLFGWALSSNLFTAIDTSSFHFQEARKHLKETRRHRAEISLMLKELNQTNYQLEHLNQMLNAARKRAEEARADRDRFILAVSHELRSPLNFIIGFSDLMVNSPETYTVLENWPAGLYDDAQEIYRSSKHLLQLIDDILDLGQIDARQMTLFRERSRLDQVVHEAERMVRAAFDQKNLELTVEIQPDLPDVFIDNTRIRQVLLNLINNSLRFTEEGGVNIDIKQGDGHILVSVTDSGPGIAPEDIPKVFDEFRQVGVDSWRRREGTGLGLSISRRFVELHGGKMWLESAIGQGASFFFTLPILESIQDFKEIDPGGAVLTTPKGYFSKQMRAARRPILVISPDPTAGDIAGQWLEDYEIVAVKDPGKIVEQAAQHMPGAILVDKVLVDTRHIAIEKLPNDIPVISIIFPSIRGRYQKLPEGVSGYLVKPVSRESLIQAIRQIKLQHNRLLLVDDDPAMLRFVRQALKAAHNQDHNLAALQVLTAYNGSEALLRFQEGEIDAVVLDLDLPDMTGWQVLEEIRRQDVRASTSILIVSAHDLPRALYDDDPQVFSLHMRRALSQQELPKVLHALLREIAPSYTPTKIVPGETLKGSE